MPKGTEHTIEFVDAKGSVQKVYRANSVVTHPDFISSDARISLEQSAVDVAIVKFNCSLPASIKSAKIVDYNQVPISANLTIAGFGLTKSEYAMAEENETRGLGRILTEDAPEAIQLMQAKMRLQSVDFPGATVPGKNKNAPGIFSLSGSNGQSSCDGDSGGPAFFDDGHGLLLVATLSSGAAYCERANARYTITSQLISWMESVLGTGVISFVGRTQAAKQEDTHSTEVKGENSASKSELSIDQIPTQLPTALPSANKTPIPVKTSAPRMTPVLKPTQPQPQVAKITKPRSIPNPVVEKDDDEVLELNSESQNGADVEKICEGKKWSVNAKTRVWGTVLKLVDKDSTQITDESLKCDFPNESELCLAEHPLATGSGNAKADLLNDIELAGCDKFKSGKTIYLFLPDFLPR